jgi:hypothetical protein
VRLTSLSQHTLESLLELQLEVVTSVITSAAAQLESVSRSRNLGRAVAGQAEELRAARDRIAADLERVIGILTRAGRGIRTVAMDAYSDAVRPAAAEVSPARKVRRKAAKKAKRGTKSTGRKSRTR